MKNITYIDLEQSVYEICKMHPEIKEILVSLGFTDITKPSMLQTVGRFMTIPKGANMKGIGLNLIIEKLHERGFDSMKGEFQ